MTAPNPAKISFSEAFQLIDLIKNQIESVIIGKQSAVELALTALLARGHILLEDLPGTGKTTLAKTIARSLSCDFKRIQFTPDLMPSDVTGMNYYNTKTGTFEFRPGPVLTNVLLADEINRTTPRTQSALLEAMEEKQVTIDGVTHPLQQPFLVLATQNPIESEGTFPLPFAQQDRFLMRIKLDYPLKADESIILQKHTFGDIVASLEPVLSLDQVLMVQELTQQVYLEETLVQYILDLVEITRQSETVELALSPRASISMVKAARAMALVKGRDYVLPDDIKLLCIPVFAHRLKLKKAEKYKGAQVEDFLKQLLDKIPLSLRKREQ
ncbi:MoxR-like ATPase [Desulfotomaculum arcticum]|uniref:MoxR-like ATPase n=1 Tax=Desulfotruncus arcticus DSM 17038 TaxID=1121424 RepID=A0A1I2ZSU9_9FIRM|nr:MoxR family ATPase [Desulfotruncus arcticus]SFH40962.1 MoxR-like ATPase [Desulfotomaculum arcticum] [Desulfotruncus arcticus DSM 17038]